MDSNGNGFRGGLEMTLHQQHHHHFHPQMVAFARPEPDHTLQQPQSVYPFGHNHKDCDGEEGGLDLDDNDGKRKSSSSSSPWQRMKWTDGMVRLLIMAVYYIGDECGSEGNNNDKKKAGALLQKKGKWKSVSKAMIEKGFYVSPQQCEDKFNDLNKRYKRVNEILGKGTACRVVENRSLLDQMDHLSPKSKDEVRKLLNSKHLFFREMCAYHNSCGGGGGAGGSVDSTVGHHSPEHSLAPPRNLSESLKIHRHDLGLSQIDNSNMEEKHSEDEDEEDDEDDSEEDSEVRCSTKRRREEEEKKIKEKEKEAETTSFEKVRALNEEVAGVMEDGRRSVWEKKRWMKVRMVKVEEERVGKEMEGFEIEKERLKWVKYCGNKEREMERKRLRNETGKLECDRMLLLLKHKELEMDLSPSSLRATPTHPLKLTHYLNLAQNKEPNA